MIKRTRKTNRTTKKAMESTESIIDAILTLQAKDECVTTSKVARVTGVSRFSFYTRFHNHQHALSVWEKEMRRQCLDFIRICCKVEAASATVVNPPANLYTNTRASFSGHTATHTADTQNTTCPPNKSSSTGKTPDAPPPFPKITPLVQTSLHKLGNPKHQSITAWFIFLSHRPKTFQLVAKCHQNQKILRQMAEDIFSLLDIRWGVKQTKLPVKSLPAQVWLAHTVAIIIHWCQYCNSDYTKASPYIAMLLTLSDNPARYCVHR